MLMRGGLFVNKAKRNDVILCKTLSMNVFWGYAPTEKLTLELATKIKPLGQLGSPIAPEGLNLGSKHVPPNNRIGASPQKYKRRLKTIF